jgi:anaerobic ribonucleoside-triphosphate reductase activating protein
MLYLLIHSFLPLSQANGPGKRAVIWVQGCTLGCAGCFNPTTHLASGGTRMSIETLSQQIRVLGDQIEGITVSGGEPLQQMAALIPFLQRVRQETALSVVLFSGYSWNEILNFPEHGGLLAQVDVLLAGRYQQARRVARHMIGSANKTIHFLTSRYTLADLEAVPAAEIIITADGSVIRSGINPYING